MATLRDKAISASRLSGLSGPVSAHVYAATGVLVGPGSFVLQNVELLGQRQEKMW